MNMQIHIKWQETGGKKIHNTERWFTREKNLVSHIEEDQKVPVI
jgi:hypothetical protein